MTQNIISQILYSLYIFGFAENFGNCHRSWTSNFRLRRKFHKFQKNSEIRVPGDLPSGICVDRRLQDKAFYKYLFSKKVAQKVGPGNLFNPCLKIFFSGPSPNPLDKTPNGICVWSRCRCHSVLWRKISDRHTYIGQTKSIRIVALDLGSPLRGQ